MVIQCPKCERKYQIDTARIPSGGTTFTCWTCRAAVPVLRGQTEAAPAAPPPPAAAGEGMPSSARNFFESLAGEAKSRTESPLRPRPVAEAAPEPKGAIWPPRRDAARAPAPEATAGRADEPTVSGDSSAAGQAAEPAATAGLDFAARDGILDLPAYTPGPPSAPLPADNVLELDFVPAAEDGRPVEEPEPAVALVAPDLGEEGAHASPAHSADDASDVAIAYDVDAAEAGPSERPAPAVASAPQHTLTMASLAPPSDPAGMPAAGPKRPRPLEATPAEAVRTITLVPRPSVDPNAETPRQEMPAVEAPGERFALAGPAEPPPGPVGAPAAITEPRPAPPVQTSPAPPGAPALPAAKAAPAAAVPAAEPAPAATWVSPDLDGTKTGRRSKLVPALVATLVIGVCLALLWMFVLRDVISPDAGQAAARVRQPAPKPQAPAAAAPAPAQPAAATSDSAPPPAQPAAPPAETRPASAQSAPAGGTGGYTLQVGSSKDRAASDALAASLRGAGFDAYVVQAELPGRGTWYRVRVGRFASPAEAQETLRKLRSAGGGGNAMVTPYDN